MSIMHKPGQFGWAKLAWFSRSGVFVQRAPFLADLAYILKG